jgi:1,2-diacylglycerol 3-beta-glucosyltransferase
MDMPHVDSACKTLMIVEDEVLVAMTLRDELEEAGYDVLDLTERPEEAIAFALESAPDLALVNIQLNGRNDGIALAEQLKALNIPVLFISGQVSRAKTAQTVAIGSMPKPYSPTDMVLAVTWLLASLKGDESRFRPAGLEVFPTNTDEIASAQ